MRERKFRGRKIDNKDWVYGYFAKDINYNMNGSEYVDCIIDTKKGPSEGMWFEVDPATVGQYTGLKDCKRTEECPDGQEIYEGDIVNRLTNDAVFETGVVQWSDYLSSWLIECINTDGRLILAAPGTIKGSGEVRSYEIIGNIYENPDLIKAVRG